MELGAELVRLVKVLVAMREHAPSAHPGVDATHYPVLFNLGQGPRRVSDLAGCVHADVSTVSRQVSHLVQHGLLAKLPDAEDGRAHRVSLTDEGRATIDRIVDMRSAWLAEVLADWTEAEAADLVTHLRRFADSLESAKARSETIAR